MPDLLPIILVISFSRPLFCGSPCRKWEEIIFGSLLVVAGLPIFVQGLEMGLFPLGEAMTHALARKGSLFLAALYGPPGRRAGSRPGFNQQGEESLMDGFGLIAFASVCCRQLPGKGCSHQPKSKKSFDFPCSL